MIEIEMVRIISKMVLNYKRALVLSGCSNALGLEDGRVQNSQFSSYTYDADWDPFKARLNKVGAWCSKTNDVNHEFLQIDLLDVQHISHIATQGVRGSYLWRSYYVKTFEIEYSYDGTTWFNYEGSGGSIQVSSIFSLNSFL